MAKTSKTIVLSGGNYGGRDVDHAAFDQNGRFSITDESNVEWIYDLTVSKDNHRADFVGTKEPDA